MLAVEIKVSTYSTWPFNVEEGYSDEAKVWKSWELHAPLQRPLSTLASDLIRMVELTNKSALMDFTEEEEE